MDAITRIKQLGMPRRNNELWTFFPVNKIPNILSADGNCRIADECSSSEDFANEDDFAALLPIVCNARELVKTIDDGENEMAMLKCNNDFGRTVLNVGKNAKASFEILDNKVMHEICAERFDINVAEGAELEIFFANPANDLPLTFRHFDIKQAAHSTVHFANVLQDAGIGRISARVELNGEGANFDYRSLNILKGTASKHQRLTILHNAPETVSTQFVRNILDENAYASYDGHVVVGNSCSKVNSSQLVNTILLSDGPSVSVKPVLKIYHDDVECTHGNTVGELDKDQMFYLTSRGIPSDKARAMLTKAFAKELFLELPEGPAKKRLMQVI